MTSNPPPEIEHRDRGPLERFLALFADVHRGEGGVVLLLALNVFLILTAYYIIKPVREALILAAPDGAEWKSYAAAGQALLLLGAVPAYGWVAGRVDRRKLINTVTVFFVLNMLAFFLAIKAVGPGSLVLGLGFFLWVGVFNLMVPAQFWSFANDVYTPDQGKRLFAIVAFGASLGAVLGSLITERLIEPIGLDQLLLVSSALLVVALLITNFIESREARRPRPARGSSSGGSEAQEEDPKQALRGENGFSLVFKTRYLLLIAVLMLLLNWVNTTGEYILGDTVKTTIEARAEEQGIPSDQRDQWVGENIGEFYGSFFKVVNILSLSIQLFLVSRILKYIGIRIALLILPVIAMGGYALLAFYPVLSVVRWAKTAENATDYSLQNTVRQALFLPTTREQKYKAKQAIDSFFVRAGDVLSAVLVFVGLNVLSFETKGFALFNLGLVAVWLGIAVLIGREHAKLTADED